MKILVYDEYNKYKILHMNHNIIYKNDGDLLVFENDEYGQMELGDNINRYKSELLFNDETIIKINIIYNEHQMYFFYEFKF